MLRLGLVVVAFLLTACASQASGIGLPQLVQPGVLQGHVNVGPLTPVQRADVPPPTVSPEVYAARQLILFKEDGKTEIARLKIDNQGNYHADLAPGVYVLALARSGIDRARELPATITITSGKTTTLDISIDTGIR